MESINNQHESLIPSSTNSKSNSTSPIKNYLATKISLSHFLSKKPEHNHREQKSSKKLDFFLKKLDNLKHPHSQNDLKKSPSVSKTSVDTLINTVNYNCNSGFDSSEASPPQNQLNKLTQFYHNIEEIATTATGNYNNLSETSLCRKTASTSTQSNHNNNETLLSYSPLNIYNNNNNKLLASSTLNSSPSPTYYNTLNNFSEFQQFKKKYESKQGDFSQSFTDNLDELQRLKQVLTTKRLASSDLNNHPIEFSYQEARDTLTKTNSENKTDNSASCHSTLTLLHYPRLTPEDSTSSSSFNSIPSTASKHLDAEKVLLDIPVDSLAKCLPQEISHHLNTEHNINTNKQVAQTIEIKSMTSQTSEVNSDTNQERTSELRESGNSSKKVTILEPTSSNDPIITLTIATPFKQSSSERELKKFAEDNGSSNLNSSYVGYSSPSSFSSQSISPTSTANPILNLSETSSSASSEVNNSTIKNVVTSPIPIPNSLAVDTACSPSTTPIKSSETVTPINSRFIIKKIPQAELEKYKKPSDKSQVQTDQNFKAANKQLTGEPNTAVARDESSEPLLNTNETHPVKKENVERRINKFTVKKVDSSEIFLFDPNSQTKKKPQVAEDENKLSDNKSAKNSETELKNCEVNKESAQINLGEDKNKQSQSNPLTSQSSTEEQKQPPNNVTENKANLNTNYSSSSRTNSISEKNEQTDSEKDKDQDLLEDEKPIDESPDKRFLKYDTEIGHGSFKTVYKGLDTESGVPVAWCELHDRKFNKSERQRFIEEAEMLKKLQHPNIVRFYDYWEDSKTKPKKIILVTELMTSGTLKAYVQRFKKQEKSKRFKVIKNFANQILKGLAYLHGRQPPVIHRDLKCDNVFVTGQCGQVKIGDLGLATLKKTSHAKSVIGTPEFMAPEMYSEQYDESIDVYAFGMCLLEMATGEYPYQECTKPFEIYKRVTQGIRPDNYYRIDNSDLKELIDLCIRLKKSQRPTVKELVNHSWFMDSNGLCLELHKDEKTKKIFYTKESHVLFRLKLIDKSKHKNWPDNEAIEFIFDVDNDNPEHIAKELKENVDKINDEDLRYLIQSIKNKCMVFKLEREDRLEEELLNAEKTAAAAAAVTAAAAATVAAVANPVVTNTLVNQSASSTASTLTNSNSSEGANSATIIGSTNNTQQQEQIQIPAQQKSPAQTIQAINNENANQKNYNNQPIIYSNNINSNTTTNNPNDTSFSSVNSDYNNPSNIALNNNQQQNTLAFTQTMNNKTNNQISVSKSTLNFDQQPQQASQQINQNYQPQEDIQTSETKLNQSSTSTEIPLIFTIKDFSDSPETGEVVNCVLDLDDKQTINFKFGLNADTPQDITSRLLKATNIENTSQLTDIIQNVIQYINQNKHSQVIKNKQFSAVLVFSNANMLNETIEALNNPQTEASNQNLPFSQPNLNASASHQQQNTLQQKGNNNVYASNQSQQNSINQQANGGNVSTQQQATSQSPKSNQTPSIMQHQQQQLQQSQPLQSSSNDILKSLHEKQKQITSEINKLSSFVDRSSSQINHFQPMNLNQSYQSVVPSQNRNLGDQSYQQSPVIVQNYIDSPDPSQYNKQASSYAGPQAIFQNTGQANNIQVINHKNQSFSTKKMLQNVRSLSIQECPDQNDFELQLLNQQHTQNSSELIPAIQNKDGIYIQKPSMNITSSASSVITNNVISPPSQQAVFTTMSSSTNLTQNNNILSSTITSPTVLVNKTNEINLYTTCNNNQISHSQIQQKIQQISGPSIETSSTSSLYMMNSNGNEGFTKINPPNNIKNSSLMYDNQNEIITKPSYAAVLAINLLENSRNQSNLKGEAFLDMALNETPLDQVDFTGNFEDAPINVEQLPQNQNILGNHQYLNNIDPSLASTHVINHLRRYTYKEQQQLNNNDLAELGERLKFVLNNTSSQGEINQPRQQIQHQADMILGQQQTLINSPLNNGNNGFNIIPLSDQIADNYGNNLIMTQQQHNNQLQIQQNQQIQHNLQNLKLNFQGQQFQNQTGNIIDYLNQNNYLNPPLNRTSSTIENYQNQPMNLIQSALIDSGHLLLQNSERDPKDFEETNLPESIQNSENSVESREVFAITNPQIQSDYSNQEATSHTSLLTNNNSSEKSINLTETQYATAENSSNTSKEYLLGDIFTRHRKELEAILKRQQDELHDYVLSQSRKQSDTLESLEQK